MAREKNTGTSIPGRVVRIELISYFSLYPETISTSADMAKRLSRDPDQVERQMIDLVELRILKISREGDHTLYSYLAPLSMNPALRKSGSQFRWGGQSSRYERDGEDGTNAKSRRNHEAGEADIPVPVLPMTSML